MVFSSLQIYSFITAYACRTHGENVTFTIIVAKKDRKLHRDGKNFALRQYDVVLSCGLQYSHASANPAAEAISDKGRPRRWSVKNRIPFDCFKSAAGIRFSAGARTTPKSFHRGGFWCYLLSEQKVTDKTIMEDCDSPESRGPQPRPAEARNRSRMLTRALRRLLPEQPQPPKINFTRNRRRRTAGRYKKTFAMPILASRLGGMTLHIAVRRTVRAAAFRSEGPQSFANAHIAVPAGCYPKTLNFILPFLASAIRASSIALGLTKWVPLTTPAAL